MYTYRKLLFLLSKYISGFCAERWTAISLRSNGTDIEPNASESSLMSARLAHWN